jgi:succinate dehydrogenase / fumarate reductase membrane anchor subunit
MTMKWQDTPFKNPMTRARGLGSQKSGTHHWLMQKFTAVSNMILSLWLIVQIAHGYASSLDNLTLFLQNPINAGLLILFVLSSFYHAMLGLTVVIEDYVHCEFSKICSLFAVKFIITAMGVLSILSILKLAI